MTISTQIIEDGPRYCVIKCINDAGDAETAALKVDVSTLSGIGGKAPTSVRIEEIWFDLSGMQVQILWDATTDLTAWVLSPGHDDHDFAVFGGLTNNAGAGKTGDVLFTTIGASALDSYSIVMRLIKQYN